MFPSWESAGAGRVGLAGANIQSFLYFTSALSVKITLYIGIFKIMKNYNVLSVILLAMALSNCGGTKRRKYYI
jgi:hypothetical protein